MFEFVTILFAVVIITSVIYAHWGPEGTPKEIAKKLNPDFRGAWKIYKDAQR
jgi:hypothetical protein